MWELIKVRNGKVDLPTGVVIDLSASQVARGTSLLLTCRLLGCLRTTDNVGKSNKLREF